MKIIFAGTPKFALPVLKALLKSPHQILAVYTKPDSPQGRGLKLMPSPVKQAAIEAGLPIYQPITLKDKVVQDVMRNLKADVLVDVACGFFLPKEVLELPRLGCVNVHPSLLPRWRGASPIQRAILAGDKVTGVTIMQMDEGLDTGPIFKQETTEITPSDTSLTLSEKLAELSVPLLLSVLDDLESGKAEKRAQDDTKSSYAEKLSKDEAKIDWRKSSIELDRMIRAFNPWPIAETTINGMTVRIFKAVPINETQHFLSGTIIESSKNGIDVATGGGILRLLEMQLPGGKILSAREILNSKKDLFASGMRFEITSP